MTRTGSWRPLRLCVSALFVSALVRAESPGTHYPSGGTRPGVSPQASAGTNAPYARTITIYGSVNTNDLLRFLDRTGSRVGGTNVLSALDYYGTNWQATAAAEAAARAAGDTVARTNLQASITAEALARAAGDAVSLTNWQARVNALTNGAALGATALQPSWAATGMVHQADFANEAYEASIARDAGSAVQLAPGVPDKLALDAATAHIDDPAAHPDIRDAIDAIPLPPTNAVAGWLVYDSGSNCYWRVTATNLRFYVWGVEE